MNEDYLWDKSGPPDPEILQLEEILGSLRYQPKSFELPNDVPVSRQRNYVPVLAIAATLLLALLAGGIWLRVRSRNEPHQAVIPSTPPVTVRKVEDEKTVSKPEPEKRFVPRERNNVAVHYKRRNRTPALTAREREEALAAKQQLMLALRVASEKLSLAQRKTQSTSPSNQIKNHHRVG